MPSTGTPSSSSSRRSPGAPSEYTEAGPPESTSAAGRRSRILSRAVSWGRSSEKTPDSRILRAMSCEYCPPKSITRTSSRSRSVIGERPSTAERPSVIRYGHSHPHGRPSVGAHPHRLLSLQLLSLRLQGRGDHHLGALKIANVLVAAGGHRGAKRAHQVEGAVILLRRAEQDLLEGAVLEGGNPGAARHRGMKGGHPPVEAATRRLACPGERGADHHRVRAAGDRLRYVAPRPHAAVGDHVAVLARLEHVLGARRRHVGDRGRLRDADAEHAARGAGGAGAYPDQHAHGPGAHQVEPGRIGSAAADDARYGDLGDELLQV